MPIQEFNTTLDSDQYFKGLARQTLDFHAALGELVDNSFSARHEHSTGVLTPAVIEVTVQQVDVGNVVVQVADSGIGISLDEVTNQIFNVGGQGATRGSLPVSSCLRAHLRALTPRLTPVE